MKQIESVNFQNDNSPSFVNKSDFSVNPLSSSSSSIKSRESSISKESDDNDIDYIIGLND